MADIVWTPITVTLGDLKPWTQNPRTSSKKQAQRLLKSWDDFGQVQAIAVGPGLEVYDGHQRLSALLTVHGPGYVVDARQASRELTDDERRRLVLALHAGAVGSWDWDSLSGWDARTLTAGGFDGELLAEWKRDLKGLDEFIKSEKPAPVDAEPQVDRAAELQEKWQTATGQLWRIGDHRLIVGDCTDKATAARVMGGERANLVYTDPPYGYDKGIENDENIELALGVYSGALNVIDFCEPDSWLLVDTPKKYLYDFAQETILKGWRAREPVITMYRNSMANGVYGTNIFEMSAVYSTGEARIDHRNLNGCDLSRKAGSDNLHPTQKFVDGYVHFIRMFSATGALIYDPFGGSGTTMLAAQNLGRRCRMVEISPAYCAVILERMATAFQDLVIELVEDGKAD